ncbi:DUF1214 domain-containing protein [Streptomyces sp. ITFR-6]|uniref:DUF1214 domain-containing protein n=1 Tax=Streptomyces sp. ITFR-6 TaxID=3075197 RepID=UPI00288C5554|nr:DUF1214 domain-containing protein [Streptomyces sp. ITFR-6]WNI28145.1 DUF1214 domain-containing protein [Streptomyces sp. ITFR-6]
MASVGHTSTPSAWRHASRPLLRADATPPGQRRRRAELGEDYLARRIGADRGLYGLLLAVAWYGGWVADSEGNRPPNASDRDYTVHFAADQPPRAQLFWSATPYRLSERLPVDNPINRYSMSDRTPGLVYSADAAD